MVRRPPLTRSRSQTSATVATRKFNYRHALARNMRKEKRENADRPNGPDPLEAAEEAGLRYASDNQPGYTRKANEQGFEYFDTDREPIRDEQRLLRISRLAIPPA